MPTDARFLAAEEWLKQECNLSFDSLEPASSDASFRRYFRAIKGSDSFIIMDAPPEKEPLSPFLECCSAIRSLGLSSPKVLAHTRELGFILMEDLGTRTYLNELHEKEEVLYQDAVQALVTLQSSSKERCDYKPPAYDAKKLLDEMGLFKEWYLGKHLGVHLHEPSLAAWVHTQHFLTHKCLEQPQVWVHRDFHSRNLMIIEDKNPGIIDFQDLVVGPISYDLASLFKDCYIEWPRERQLIWLNEYYQLLNTTLDRPLFTLEQLIEWYDFTGLQRHLKVLGIFCRLNYRDGKSNYLSDLPLVSRYILEVLDIYPQLETFKTHFGQHIDPETN